MNLSSIPTYTSLSTDEDDAVTNQSARDDASARGTSSDNVEI
jgi:hypothetical protein